MTRRSNTHRLLSFEPAMLVLFCPMIATTIAFPTAANAQSEQTQISYSCKYAPVGYEYLARNDAIATTVTLDVPASASPGQTLTLTGTVSMKMPEAFATLAAEYSKEAELTIEDMKLPVTITGQTSSVGMSRVQSGKISTKVSPLALGGSVTLGDIVVPADASGDIRVDMPTAGSTISKIDSTPVAFNASLTVTGGTVDPYRTVDAFLSCASAPSGIRPIATVPITVPPERDAIASPAQPNQSDAALAAPALPGGDPAAAASVQSSTSAVPTSSPILAQPGASDSAAVIPLNYRTDGLFVPGWWVLSVVVFGGVLTTGFAGWTYYRLRKLRHDLEA